jgi:hypothetical protein
MIGITFGMVTLIVNQRNLHAVLTEYDDYYNAERTHLGIDLETPIHRDPQDRESLIQRRDVLGVIIHDYYREAT